MIPILLHWLQQLLPNNCLLCFNSTHSALALCRKCLPDLPWQKAPHCRICALPLPMNTICGQCLRNPPTFDQVISPFRYEAPIDRFISQLKFHDKLIYAHILGTLFAEYVKQLNEPLPQAILPVPLHPARLRQRGYNQATEISRHIASKLKIPCCQQYLVRSRHTKAQSQLKAKARTENVKNAFKISRPIPYGHIAIVDDVITTGATLRQLCIEIKESGVKKIDVWCAARSCKR